MAGLALAAGSLAALVLVIRLLPDSYPTGDAAALSLRVLGASRGDVLVGPYSQFGWSHPGPLLFYLLAPLYWLTGFHEAAPRVTALLINTASLGGVLWIARRHAGAILTFVSGGMLAAFEWRAGGDMMFSAWNPHITLLPMAALLFTAAAVWVRWTGLWAVMLVLASFISQSDVAFVPLAAFVASTSLVGALSRLERSRRMHAALMAVGLLFLLWLPPLVEQLTGHRGNVSRLVAFVSDSRGSRAPASRSIDLFAHTYMILFSSGMRMPTGGPAPSAAAPLAVIGATATLIAVIASSPVARVGRHAFLSAFCLLSAVASLVALASVFFIRGEAADYMVLWIGAIGALSVAATVSVLVAPVRLSWRAQKILSAIAWSIAALLVGVSSVRLAAWQRAAGREREPLRLYDAIASDMTNLHARRAVIRHTANSWEQVVGVVLTGEKRGRRLSVSDDMTRVTGAAYRSRGDEDVEFTIFDPVLDGDVAMTLRRARTRRVGWLVVATVPRPR